MNRSPSSLWLSPPKRPGDRIEAALQAGLRASRTGRANLFFRADDIGVPGGRFNRLMAIFAKFRTPISLAVVPVWLTRPRWEAMGERIERLESHYPIAGEGPRKSTSIWCWHQHGWRHQNHESTGKKQEFGPSRAAADIERDLRRGSARLASIMGEDFFPAFTPPWNRCGAEALKILQDLGYRAISRSRGASPAAPGPPEFSVNVDLHTRRETDPQAGWASLFAELEAALSSGFCGIMIHHQRMNDAAFEFLEHFLGTMSRFNEVRPVHLRDLSEALADPTVEAGRLTGLPG